MEHSDPHPVPEDQVQVFLFGEMMNRFSNKQSPKTQTLLFSAQICSKILQKTNEKTMVQKLYGRSRQGIIGSKNPVRIPLGYCQKDPKSHQKPFQSGSVSGIWQREDQNRKSGHNPVRKNRLSRGEAGKSEKSFLDPKSCWNQGK